jgi:hypothetical protein
MNLHVVLTSHHHRIEKTAQFLGDEKVSLSKKVDRKIAHIPKLITYTSLASYIAEYGYTSGTITK